MNTRVYAAVLVAVMAVVTILLRGLPFFVFRKETPRYILYLGQVLPAAIIGMLVIYCLKDVSLTARPYGIPELSAGLVTVVIQAWKRSSLISILSGTLFYMALIRIMI